MNLENPHIGELTLRRRRIGEDLGPDGAAIDAHVGGCAECRARARAIDEEQRRFEQEISFDRFAAGVERAARTARRTMEVRQRWSFKSVWAYPVLAVAAAAALLVTFRAGDVDVDVRSRGGENRIKGGAGLSVRVSGAAGQRTARVDAIEALAPGERLRIGYQPGDHRYVLALSIDAQGAVTPLHPQAGPSRPVPEGSPAAATQFLPEAWELTGAGLERVVVLLSDRPIDVDAARRAARAAYDRAKGDLLHLPPLGLPGEELSRVFRKP